MKTFSLAAGDTWTMPTDGIHALTVTMHNESATDPVAYAVTLGPTTSAANIPAGGDAVVGRWLAAGNELTVKNTSAAGGPTFTGVAIGGARLPPGQSAQFATTGSGGTLTVLNDSVPREGPDAPRAIAYVRTWCGGEQADVQTTEVAAGATVTRTVDCGDKPVSATNIRVEGSGAFLVVEYSPPAAGPSTTAGADDAGTADLVGEPPSGPTGTGVADPERTGDHLVGEPPSAGSPPSPGRETPEPGAPDDAPVGCLDGLGGRARRRRGPQVWSRGLAGARRWVGRRASSLRR